MRFNMTGGSRVGMLSAVVLCMAGCAVAETDTADTAVVARTVVLGTYRGEVDLERGVFTLEPMGDSPSGEVGGAQLALTPSLSTLDAATFGSSPDAGAAAGSVNMVELKQLSAVRESAWDTVNCGATPTAGVCVQIRARNLFPDLQVARTYVELTALAPSSPTTNVSARSNTTSDAQFGVSTTLGAWRYGRLNRSGKTGDNLVAYWPFVGTGASPLQFTFQAVVKGLLVVPAVRASTRDATNDTATNYNSGTPGTAVSGSANVTYGNRTGISESAQYVTFASLATNLVSPATPVSESHIYRKDLSTGTTVQVDVDSAGTRVTGCNSYSPTMSASGARIAFVTTCRLNAADVDALTDVYVRDVAAGATYLASVDSTGTKANAASGGPYIAMDASVVVFETAATNMRDQFGTTYVGTATQVYSRDFIAGTTRRVSVVSGGAGTYPNALSLNAMPSGDGTRIIYESNATNIVTPDTNAIRDIFLLDVTAGTVTRVDVSTTGAQANRGGQNAAISGDGLVVAFQSAASNLVTVPMPAVINHVYARTVAAASSLVRISDSPADAPGNGASTTSVLSRDGRFVAFLSAATNLVPESDTNAYDVYTYDRGTTDPTLQRAFRVSVSETGAGNLGAAPTPGPIAISGDGTYLSFAFSGAVAAASPVAQQVVRVPNY